MLKFLPLLTLVCLQVNGVLGQTTDASPLSVGDTVPELAFHHLLHYSRPDADLSAFRGKAILIDFWETFCEPCISQFPKLKSLQSKFGDDLQVITVTFNETAQITAFFDKIKYQDFSLVTATGIENAYLNRLFPHHYIPHYIWIGKDHIVKAITGYEEVTEKNITALVNEGPLQMPLKKDNTDTVSNYALFNPSLEQYLRLDLIEQLTLSDSIPGLLAYSMLSGYDKKYPPSVAITDSGFYKDRRISIRDLPLSTISRIAYGRLRQKAWEFEMISIPRFFLDVKNTEHLRKLSVTFNTKPDTTQDMYCYDLITPYSGKELLLGEMRKDLLRYFGIKGSIEPRKLLCYTLVMKDSTKLLSRGGTSSAEGNIYFITMKNVPFEELVYNLRFYNEGSKLNDYTGLQSGIIVDKTHFSGNIDIDLKVKLNDPTALKSALEQYGLDLVPGEQMVDVLVLRDE